MQDWAADYDGEGQERVAREGGDSAVAMRRWRQRTTMVVVDDDGNGGQRQRWMTKAADDDGTQDQAADYEGEGGERTVNNNGIRHKEKPAKQKA